MTRAQGDGLDERRLLDRVEAKLLRLGASFERAERSITVHAATDGGFEAGVVIDGGRFHVWFEGWHEPFADAPSIDFHVDEATSHLLHLVADAAREFVVIDEERSPGVIRESATPVE